jgi:hypothetical protein
MTTTATTTANARTLALAHYAARGVLEHVLSRHGMTFQQQVILRAAAAVDALATDELVAEVQRGSRPPLPTSGPPWRSW